MNGSIKIGNVSVDINIPTGKLVAASVHQFLKGGNPSVLLSRIIEGMKTFRDEHGEQDCDEMQLASHFIEDLIVLQKAWSEVEMDECPPPNGVELNHE